MTSDGVDGLSVARSSVHRLLGSTGWRPANQKHQRHGKRWQRYEKPQPGNRLQMHVKFLERIPGTRKRLFQFTAIDDCTRIRVLKVYDACNQSSAIPVPKTLQGQGFWTRKFRVPVTLSSRTSMRQLPGDPVLVANVPVIERSRLYTSAPDGGRIVSVAVPPEICPD